MLCWVLHGFFLFLLSPQPTHGILFLTKPRSPQVETIEGKLMWLEGRLGMDRDKAVKVVLTFPVMLSMALDTMDWKILWLQQRLSLTREQMMAVVVKYPNLLSYNIEDNLEPTLKWLEEDLGVDTAVAGKLVLRQPRLLSANLEDNLKNKVCSLEGGNSWDEVALYRFLSREVLSERFLVLVRVGCTLLPSFYSLESEFSLDAKAMIWCSASCVGTSLGTPERTETF